MREGEKWKSMSDVLTMGATKRLFATFPYPLLEAAYVIQYAEKHHSIRTDTMEKLDTWIFSLSPLLYNSFFKVAFVCACVLA